MEKLIVTDIVCGVPFIDSTFSASKLFGIVAVHRAKICGLTNPTLKELTNLINPIEAVKFAHENYPEHPPIHSKLIEGKSRILLDKIIEEIIQKIPDWEEFINGPFLFLQLMNSKSYSLTNPMIPQSIFLGIEALHSEENLAETLIHELSHSWLALINEVSPLADPNQKEEFTLPSGTKGKSTLGTILAAHFAGSALNFYQKSKIKNPLRVEFLNEYLFGCINILKKAKGLTDEGKKVLMSLDNFYEKKKTIYNIE